MSTLAERITLAADQAAAEAMRGCGLSDVLYASRMHSSYLFILEQASDAERHEVEAILLGHGYDPNFEEFVAGEGECELTGIDVDHCPCGRHP